MQPIQMRKHEGLGSEDGSGAAVLLEAEKRMLAAIAGGEALEAVLTLLVKTVEEQIRHGALTSVLLLDGSGRLRHGAAPSLPAAYNAAIDGLAIGPEVGSCGTAAFHRKLVIVSDVSTDVKWAPFVELTRTHGLRACWSIPIVGTGDKVLGTFAMYYREPREPAPADVAVLERVALIARIAIEQHRTDTERATLMREAQTARAEAEAERATLRDFIMEAPAILCLLRGPDHVYVLANPPYLELVGNRSILGKPVREALPELAGQGFYELLDGVYSTGKPFVGHELPAQLQGRDGLRKVFVNFVYQPTRAADGTVNGIAVYANDVTEFVAARTSLAETLTREKEVRAVAEANLRQFRAMFDSMPQLGWTAQPDGAIDFYNSGWYAYTGTNFEQMQGWGWRTVHDPEMLPEVVERWQHSLATGTPFEMEFPLRRHDGAFRWFLTRVNPMRDATGKLVRWVGVNTDIDDIRAARALSEEIASQSRQAEAMLREMRAAKEAAERRVAELEKGRTV